MPTPEEITRHHPADPDEDPWVDGPPSPEAIALRAYDPAWPARFAELASALRDALGDVALALEHVGSTSVPGLAAKDVIDIDLTVADPRAEDAYVPALARLGYVLTVREPSWHEHRCLRLTDPRVNLHVFGPDCPEVVRHRLFRDRLRADAADRALYESAKLAALPATGHGQVEEYNARKETVIHEIYARAFRAAGLR